MDNEFTSYWTEILRWTITTLVFGFYIALTFFSFRGDWNFLKDFEYWTVTLSATSIAWFLRFLWASKGLNLRLIKSEDIKEKQIGKGKLIQKININNLTDVLELKIKEVNKKEKLKQYKNKCLMKKQKYQGKKWFPFKGYSKKRFEFWKQEHINVDKEDFNVDVVRVKYYKYDIDSMLSSSYKPSKQTETRGNLNVSIAKSYRTTMITMIAFAVLGALQVFIKDFSGEALFVLLGRLIVFVINIYSGLNLGISFVDSIYSKDLTNDYVFMKRVLKESKIKDLDIDN
jgi:hypothetical protein